MKGIFTKHYGDKAVLENFSLETLDGKINRLFAPSGSGKTTLLRLLSGLEENENKEANDFNGKTFAWVFQEDRLTPSMSAYNNVMYAAKASKDSILEAFNDLSLDEPYKRIDQYSGGMKRRVALIRALLSDGEILILDEPFTGLDKEAQSLACKAILKYQRERTVILVTHEDDEEISLPVEKTIVLPVVG